MKYPTRLHITLSRFGRMLQALRFGPGISKWVFRAIFASVGILAVFAWRSISSDQSPNYLLLIVAFLITLNSLLIASIEFRVSSSLAKITLGRKDALRTTLFGSIANILPVPGSQLVRAGALVNRGMSVKRASVFTFLTGLVRLAVTVIVSSLFIFAEITDGQAYLVVIAVVIAAVLQVIGDGQASIAVKAARLVVIDAALAILQILRFIVLGTAFGFSVEFSDAAAVTFAATVAISLGILPSGIGVREALAVAITPLIALDWSQVLVLSVSDQVITYLTLLLAALVLRHRVAAT